MNLNDSDRDNLKKPAKNFVDSKNVPTFASLKRRTLSRKQPMMVP